jgi:anti-sigma factor RsiW
MGLQTNDRRLMRDYLLGRLDEPGRERAEAYFDDPDLYDELIEAENDLLDQYARGDLTEDEREAFERYLDHLPDGDRKLAFARAFVETAARESEEAESILAAESALARRSWFQSWLALMQMPAMRIQFGVAVALIVLLAGSTLLLLAERERTRRESEARTSEQEALRRKVEFLERQVASEASRSADLQTDLDQAEQRGADQMQEIARLRSQPSPVASLVFPVLSLLKGGAPPSKTPVLAVNPKTQIVSFTVPLDGDEEYSRYGAVLQTREGERIWEQQSRPLRSAAKSVLFRLPAASLNSADYTLTVILTSRKDNLELPFNYHFSVVKKD